MQISLSSKDSMVYRARDSKDYTKKKKKGKSISFIVVNFYKAAIGNKGIIDNARLFTIKVHGGTCFPDLYLPSAGRPRPSSITY